MEVAELNMLRFPLGVTRMDNITNEYIRRQHGWDGLEGNTRGNNEVVWTCTDER